VSTLPPSSNFVAPPPSGNTRRKSASPRRASGAPASGASLPPSEAPIALPAKVETMPRESRTMRIARGVVGFLMVVGIGGTVAWGARKYVKTSPRFAITEVITTGAKRRSPDELASVAGIAKGQNVFTADLDRARARLIADPWVSEASLARQLPGTVSCASSGAKPAAAREQTEVAATWRSRIFKGQFDAR